MLSEDRQVLNWQLDLLDTFTAHDYNLQIIITQRLVFSVMLLGSNFQPHTLTTLFSWYFLLLIAPALNWFLS